MHYNPSSAEFSGDRRSKRHANKRVLLNGGLDDGNVGENQNETPEDESFTRLQEISI